MAVEWKDELRAVRRLGSRDSHPAAQETQTLWHRSVMTRHWAARRQIGHVDRIHIAHISSVLYLEAAVTLVSQRMSDLLTAMLTDIYAT